MIDDLEDITVSFDSLHQNRYGGKNGLNTYVARTYKKRDNEVIEADSIIPGTQIIYIKTWGCSHNNSDSEYMAGLLQQYGYRLTDDKQEANLWLLNSCTVKNPAEDHFRNEVEIARKHGKYIVVAGCVPQGAPKLAFLKGLSVIGVQQIDRVVEVVEETLKGHSVRLFGQKKKDGKKLGGASLDLPKIRKNPLIEIIPINTGCLNQCTYCKTKHARGNLGSYTPDEIEQRARQAFSEGVVELWLTSEDTGTYGRDIGSSLPELLWRLLAITPNNCMIRIGMTNPPYILEHLESMVEILSHPRVYSFLHIPVQSGSDHVLYSMNREYTRSDFEYVVDFLKNRVNGITIATDIICGFPTETEEDFEQTMNLCKKYKFPSLFINQFYPRPGTPAARLIRVPADQVKKRTKRLAEWFQSYKPYSRKINEVQRILITEEATDGLHYAGHNKYYEQMPSSKEEWLEKAREFEDKWSFPHAIAAMDGKHVMLQAPAFSGTDFYNYKNFFSIVLFALVDANYNFMYVDVGCQGRISDDGVFKNTALYEKLEKRKLNIPEPCALRIPYSVDVPYMILGDKAFALNDYTMKPFDGNPEVGSPERIFNYRHSRARRVVENSFGILSAVFRVLRKSLLLQPEIASKVVLATIYLHNFLRERPSSTIYTPPGSLDMERDGVMIDGRWRHEPSMSSFLPIRNIPRRANERAKTIRLHLADHFVLNDVLPWQNNF